MKRSANKKCKRRFRDISKTHSQRPAFMRKACMLNIRRIFSHPDYHRRLWNHTRSADLVKARKVRCQALAGLSEKNQIYRRWGITPRPEDVQPTELTASKLYVNLNKLVMSILNPHILIFLPILKVNNLKFCDIFHCLRVSLFI